MARRIVMSWSGGKDCAWALQRLRADPAWQVVGLVSTVAEGTRHLPMHGVSAALLEAQALRLGLPLQLVPLPEPCPNAQYEARLQAWLSEQRAAGVEAVGFGDLHLADVRGYRERLCAVVGVEPVFPLWGEDTSALAAEMIQGGLRAIVTSVDARRLDAKRAGRAWDAGFIRDLPPDADPCGENGEFHSYVVGGAGLSAPISVVAGGVHEHQGMYMVSLELAP